MTEFQHALLAKLAQGGRIVHSRDGDRAWLSGQSNSMTWGDLDWGDLAALRNAGLICDEDNDRDEDRFAPAEVISAAGLAIFSVVAQ